MIVQPNFLDHWKTRLLVSELGGDEFAPFYVLRLWGHCQEQKTSRFPKLSAPSLAAICRAKTSAEQLWLAMQNSGFIRVKNGVVVVHQWDEYNAGLLTSWENGRKGGRPKKPTGNPRDTRGQPEANPLKTDREDRLDRDDKMDENKGDGSALLVPLLLNVPEFLAPFTQWQAIRRKGKKPKSGWDEYFAKQLAWLEPFGLATAIEIVSTSARNEWQGLFEPKGAARGNASTNRRASFA